MNRRRLALGLVALMAWSGLSIQLYLVLIARWQADLSLLAGLVHFFSFFTVLTNTLAAAVLTCALTTRPSRGRTWLLQAWVSAGIGVSIVVVGLAYNLLLRHLWHPEGWQRLADELLHDVMPLLYLAYWWLCVEKGQLRVWHCLVWAIYPLLYFVYVMLRGHLVGTYPYPFIDVGTLGYGQVLLNALGILLGFVLVSLGLIALDRWRAAREQR